MRQPTCTRRHMLKLMASAPLLSRVGMAANAPAPARRYHLCLASKEVAKAPYILELARNAGVTDVWQAAFFYGHWYETAEGLVEARKVVEDAGLRWHLINVPLGHPGDALGDASGATPLKPPGRWQNAQRPDGSLYSGTSLHPPATEENVAALRALAVLKPDTVFLDDDFRLATGPGVIGGCFCPEHKKRFCELHGYGDAQWAELLEDVKLRRLSPTLRAWVDFTCDELTACFRAQQAAIPGTALGNMVMYLGAEKAGIRLQDYAGSPLRVGELMFDDASFGNVKGKCNELFSVLFHRRFTTRELAYSETTAYPHDKLSAENLAAKLVVSTIADVGNTMFMSGITPFPQAHWETLGPAMKAQAELHARVAGHALAGPLVHYWGEAARYVGDDNPFSLFLALGVPFRVSDAAEGGMVFLGDQDAQHLGATPGGGRFVCRAGVTGAPDYVERMPEELESLWPLKRRLVEGTADFPYVVQDVPVVCAWYPTAGAVLLWNLQEKAVEVAVRWQGRDRQVALGPLGASVMDIERSK